MTISEKEALISKLKIMKMAMNGDAELINGTCNSILEISRPKYRDEEVDNTLSDIYADLIDAVAFVQNASTKLKCLLNNLEG